MEPKPIICLGSAIWDTIFQVDAIPDKGTKVLPSRAVQVASGMATSAAVAIARLGGSVQLWSRIGADESAARFVAELQIEGVGTDQVRQIPGVRTPFSSIIVDKYGERLVIPFYDPAMATDTSWLPMSRIASAAAVLTDVRWVDGAATVLREARRCALPAVLDADTAPRDVLEMLVPLATHVVFSESAFRILSGDCASEASIREMGRAGSAEVVGVTLGERGAIVWSRSSQEAIRFAAPRVIAADTLNAGDVWHGAFVLGLTRHWPLHNIIALANLAAAMKCEVFGGRMGAPTCRELKARARSLGLPFDMPGC